MVKRKIFCEGKNYHRRANFGWQDQNTALAGVKMGYKDSADCLLEQALKDGEDCNIRVLDTYIFPIIFLYRHSVEASIKAIYYRAYGKIPKGGHDLVLLWDNTYNDVILTLESNRFIEEVSKYKENFILHQIKGIVLQLVHLVRKLMKNCVQELTDKMPKLGPGFSGPIDLLSIE